ncbi:MULTISPECIES: non-heme iron oxygenase ferredoxin subunit [Bradyrhizobium]|uniref:non-heme iron oxygenase ferredoxin subunit n=1 Tax=Bradyrhizobium centrosematis TaxID=1300039 RepID=UPI0021672592|nr:non-heme iron oxygenase ferredoxin subunit [Bradyrhizobium centrosematis]MCS3765641.1 nitrite reductase/ring-hydroxylating ferredoxin subunit [Bradyrhizobium centrosematis]MCS3778175.1 nitrite reductase/ring-hydroxylating ferredoxin subunit [Bradyrhizobium centrosematis]
MQVIRDAMSDNWVTVISAGKVPAGEMIGVELGELRLAIFNVAGKFYATSNVCTHQFALLTDGWLADSVVECPLHGGQFDVTCGRALGGIVDCDLQTYAIREIGGVLQIGV